MKTLMMAATLAAGLSGMAHADGHANDVKLQLQWVTQAQFAGYYVALDEGFYEEEGLNVTILPGGPDIAPPQVLAGGGADVMLNWMPSALAAREKGLPVVNIAQPFKTSGLMLTCWKDTGITGPQDFKGKTIGVWFFGNEYPFFVDKMERFVRASMKGWKWAEENQEAAAMIVLDNDETGAQTEAHQVRMMGEIAKLTAGSNGALDEADYQRTVDTLLAGGSDPVISAAPSGAWTSVITDAALN